MAGSTSSVSLRALLALLTDHYSLTCSLDDKNVLKRCDHCSDKEMLGLQQRILGLTDIYMKNRREAVYRDLKDASITIDIGHEDYDPTVAAKQILAALASDDPKEMNPNNVSRSERAILAMNKVIDSQIRLKRAAIVKLLENNPSLLPIVKEFCDLSEQEVFSPRRQHDVGPTAALDYLVQKLAPEDNLDKNPLAGNPLLDFKSLEKIVKDFEGKYGETISISHIPPLEREHRDKQYKLAIEKYINSIPTLQYVHSCMNK